MFPYLTVLFNSSLRHCDHFLIPAFTQPFQPCYRHSGAGWNPQLLLAPKPIKTKKPLILVSGF
jgi:hypothetical protein